MDCFPRTAGGFPVMRAFFYFFLLVWTIHWTNTQWFAMPHITSIYCFFHAGIFDRPCFQRPIEKADFDLKYQNLTLNQVQYFIPSGDVSFPGNPITKGPVGHSRDRSPMHEWGRWTFQVPGLFPWKIEDNCVPIPSETVTTVPESQNGRHLYLYRMPDERL